MWYAEHFPIPPQRGRSDFLRRRKGLGGLSASWWLCKYELPLVLYLYYFANQITRPVRGQAIMTALPLLLFYLLYDIYYLHYGRLPRLIELAVLPELIDVLPAQHLMLLAPLVLLAFAFLLLLDIRRWPSLLAGLVPLLIMYSFIVWRPDLVTRYIFPGIDRSLEVSQDKINVKYHGRITMMLYLEARRIQVRRLLAGGTPRQSSFITERMQAVPRLQRQARPRNLHVVILESFLDPSLLQEAKLSSPAGHQRYTETCGPMQGLAISPVFGGLSAEAEFEILCGVPALHLVASAEFNSFTGAPVMCLPRVLAHAGYRTMATNDYKPWFFNAPRAYKAVGFTDISFPREYLPSGDSYLTIGDPGTEEYIFLGDLLQQNRAMIKRQLDREPDRPIFNYIVSQYGHHPHHLDTQRHPPVITLLSPPQLPVLERYINQYYYRTEALAAHIAELRRLDPEGVILCLSDHLPVLDYGIPLYHELKYLGNRPYSIQLNRFLLNLPGVGDMALKNYYELSNVLLGMLTGDFPEEHRDLAPLRRRQSDEARQAYLAVMQEATTAP